jgi:hypothetical protein
MKKLLAIAFASALVGCASVQYETGPSFLGSERQSERSYVIGQSTSAFVGNTMIRVQDFRVDRYSSQEVEITNTFNMSGFGLNRQFSEGERFRLGGRTLLNDQEFQFFIVGTYGILFDQNGSVQDRVLNLMAYPPTFLVYNYENNGGPGSVSPVINEQINVSGDGQNYEIIYSGTDGNSINLIYREYTDRNLARESFFQNLTYPASSDSIRFRDLLIDVERVSSEEIVFTVVQDDTTQ